jgi:uncharacterized protein (TIGR02588 family)
MSAPPHPRNAVENAVFGVGLLLLVGLVALLVMEWVQRPGGGPRLTVSAGTPDGALVPVEVRNDGGTVAEAVRVEVCRGATCGEAEIPYVPAGAAREAVVGADGVGEPRARVVGYLTP